MAYLCVQSTTTNSTRVLTCLLLLPVVGYGLEKGEVLSSSPLLVNTLLENIKREHRTICWYVFKTSTHTHTHTHLQSSLVCSLFLLRRGTAWYILSCVMSRGHTRKIHLNCMHRRACDHGKCMYRYNGMKIIGHNSHNVHGAVDSQHAGCGTWLAGWPECCLLCIVYKLA